MRTLLVVLFVWGMAAGADQVHDYYDGTNGGGDAISAAIYEAIRLATATKEPPSTLSGVCDYKGTTCPGAKVNLYDGPKLIDTVTIDNTGVFRFHGLKDYFHYNVEVDYDRYKVKAMKKNVHPGKDPIHIEVK